MATLGRSFLSRCDWLSLLCTTPSATWPRKLAAEGIHLRPVPFHYKTDTKQAPQFGLIAEEVAKVNPALVLPDQEGKPYSVRYEAVNAMLLNEFLKKHRKVAELGLVSRLLRSYLRLGAA